jgi:DNA repair exonuclease SbcCD ATPase subunit
MDTRIIGTSEFRQAAKDIDDSIVLFDDLDKQANEYADKIDVFAAELEAAIKARTIIQTVAEMVQQTVEARINKIVNLALEIVFQEDSPVFSLKIVQRRNQLEADVMVDGMDDILDSTGGGVADVVAFAMRFAMWSFSPKKRNVLVLDEPFRNLSKDYQSAVAEMVSVLSQKTNSQIIMVSHHAVLSDYVNNTIEVKKS